MCICVCVCVRECVRARALFLRPVRAKSTRSLSPSLSSGMPDSMVFNLILPTMSLLITLPLAFTWRTNRGHNLPHMHHDEKHY